MRDSAPETGLSPPIIVPNIPGPRLSPAAAAKTQLQPMNRFQPPSRIRMCRGWGQPRSGPFRTPHSVPAANNPAITAQMEPSRASVCSSSQARNTIVTQCTTTTRPECARPQALQAPYYSSLLKFSTPACSPMLLRPGAGALQCQQQNLHWMQRHLRARFLNTEY